MVRPPDEESGSKSLFVGKSCQLMLEDILVFGVRRLTLNSDFGLSSSFPGQLISDSFTTDE